MAWCCWGGRLLWPGVASVALCGMLLRVWPVVVSCGQIWPVKTFLICVPMQRPLAYVTCC